MNRWAVESSASDTSPSPDTPSSFFLLPSSFFLLHSSFFLLPSSFFLLHNNLCVGPVFEIGTVPVLVDAFAASDDH
ncbi:hypothetical protein [Paraburkholderia phenazinium]|uniref:hypothetical protein n=1 Tax=Paraburkholderia phenazinium TaxID=60549 RepID=UPI00158F5BA3|nr:hypothetical protein [Paraburkholderia phenazinium]